MRFRVEWSHRCREQHGRGSGGSSLLDKAQHRFVFPAGPSLYLAGPDVLHPGVADRAIVVEQNPDDEAFIVLPVSCRGTAAFRWHRGSLRKFASPDAFHPPSVLSVRAPGWLRQPCPSPAPASDSFYWSLR